ncbi:uncharacterized protein BX664DRAFT_334826 [Halteromyces radiatus]|uniref:uncharacterized protein n=1 Tax=Halteromyces radiatus TaxID=101107 RepID=UPI002221211E|nr:uncharacterized protein BX664DRAFT_334826 [Halteromyces radiatus]KAI8086062.1 hypothetical protein BX664DRAFT_334826 [Halteromyces radiatus]
MTLPTYDQLPIDSKYPEGTAWGVWGDDDNLGTLNIITEEITAEASKYIKKGKVFPVNWELEKPSPTLFTRPSVVHHFHPFADGLGNDDSYENFNTQSSTQWDGLGHVAHLKSGKFYNNVDPTEIGVKGKGRLGIHHMARKGIATRAVLLDYGRWAEKHKPDFDPFERIEVSVDELELVAKAQNVTFKTGDVLLVRFGWTARYEQLGDQVKEYIKDPEHPIACGIKACPETFAWIWNHHFAAVGGDCPAFEAFPPTDWTQSCHQFLLGGIGCPIGEMFFLEAVAEDCAQDNVYEFFFTSAPLNKFKGIASPPNALCIK